MTHLDRPCRIATICAWLSRGPKRTFGLCLCRIASNEERRRYKTIFFGDARVLRTPWAENLGASLLHVQNQRAAQRLRRYTGHQNLRNANRRRLQSPGYAEADGIEPARRLVPATVGRAEVLLIGGPSTTAADAIGAGASLIGAAIGWLTG
jgi:hypothetical protein